MSRVSNIFRNYKYSLKRRISATYISIYIIVYLIVLIAFSIGYISYSCTQFTAHTTTIAETALKKLNNIGENDMDEFRFELLAIGEDKGASELLIFSSDDQLIVSTSYGQSIINFFEDSQRNIITSFFPQITKLDQGYYTDILYRRGDCIGF